MSAVGYWFSLKHRNQSPPEYQIRVEKHQKRELETESSGKNTSDPTGGKWKKDGVKD